VTSNGRKQWRLWNFKALKQHVVRSKEVPPTSKQALEARYMNHKSGTGLETEEPPDVQWAAEESVGKNGFSL
jgi:hypothetical protein